MLAFIFRLLFSLGVVVWYSMNVWKMIGDYFNNEFKKVVFNQSDEYEYEEL